MVDERKEVSFIENNYKTFSHNAAILGPLVKALGLDKTRLTLSRPWMPIKLD
jgi:hypothetical protein